jgi:hypothetical protein
MPTIRFSDVNLILGGPPWYLAKIICAALVSSGQPYLLSPQRPIQRKRKLPLRLPTRAQTLSPTRVQRLS